MKEFRSLVQAQFDKMCATGKLFRSKTSGRVLWETYLNNMEKSIFRDPGSSTYNCNHCSNFIQRYGNIVSIEGDKLVSIFDIEIEGEYKLAAQELAKVAKSGIESIFVETYDNLNSLPYERCTKTDAVYKLGVDTNTKEYTKEEVEKYGKVVMNKLYTFEHLSIKVPKQFVNTAGKSIEALVGTARDDKNVFQRALKEIELDTLELVRDMIVQGSLINGEPHLYKVESFIEMKKAYTEASDKDIWCWLKSSGYNLCRFGNELIGTLCYDIQENGVDKAWKDWNYRVDPQNYMKVSAPVSQKKIDADIKYMQENGYETSFIRRFAILEDVRIELIKHINNAKKPVSIFDGVKSASNKAIDFNGIQSVSIQDFMDNILPTCSTVEVYLKNKYQDNLVTLTTAAQECKPLFAWNNNFSWTYSNNLTGKSEIKQQVKSKGGFVDGILRGSIVWNDDTKDMSDYDLWCEGPNERIGYNTEFRKDRNGRISPCGGQLDLDVITPNGVAVENIYFKDRSKLKKGIYNFYVHICNNRSANKFKFQLEMDGKTFDYEYVHTHTGSVKIPVVTVKYDGVEFSASHHIQPSISEDAVISLYGLNTNEFHKVNLLLESPNHWDKPIGNKHYMFMLENCKADKPLRGFHVENLNSDLLQCKRTLEIFANKSKIEPDGEQLSGLGFNSSVRDELIVRVDGSHKRILKILI